MSAWRGLTIFAGIEALKSIFNGGVIALLRDFDFEFLPR